MFILSNNLIFWYSNSTIVWNLNSCYYYFIFPSITWIVIVSWSVIISTRIIITGLIICIIIIGMMCIRLNSGVVNILIMMTCWFNMMMRVVMIRRSCVIIVWIQWLSVIVWSPESTMNSLTWRVITAVCVGTVTTSCKYDNYKHYKQANTWEDNPKHIYHPLDINNN